MRVGYVVLATLATVLASAKTEAATADSIDKKTFTITSPESNDTLNGVYVQSGGKKFLILHLDDDAKQSDETQTTQDSGDDDSSSNEDDSASDDQEERGAGVSADTAAKLSKQLSGKVKKQFPGEYNTFWNRFWWRVIHKMVPSKNQID
ncbi:hypothetical protein KRP22_012396 [Phytophthora ramorum]|nr:hypothetical protein KRP22_13207 [Phytophthora ramorum]